MNRTRAVSLTALAAAAALVLAACGSSSDNSSSSSASSASSAGGGGTQSAATGSGSSSGSGTITYAAEQEWYDYNSVSGSGNSTANGTVLNQVLRNFWLIDSNGKYQADTEFGTIEKLSDNPLTVKYTLADGATWSDGQPIACADLLLGWASQSGRLNKDGTINQPGSPPATPVYLFDAASTSGMDATQKPTCAEGDNSFTIVYDKPFVDWNANLNPLYPAHVAAKAAGIDNAALIKAIETDDVATLTKVAEFWNTGWTLDKAKGLPDASLIPASGPYIISAWDPGQSVTFSANPKWWGTPPKTDTIVFRFITQDQQVSALQSGEVDVIQPQPNPDTNASLAALGDQVKADFGTEFFLEHLDLNVKTAFANEKLREAFFKCVPRQQIVDNLIVPANPDAKILDSLTTLNFQDGYEAAAAASGYQAFDQVDIEGAKAAYAASGEAPGKTIKISHIDPNPRRTNEVALIKASCDQAGFDIQDNPGSSDVFTPAVDAGNYDVALFAWAGSGLYGSIPPLYLSTGGQSTAGWVDPELDATMTSLATSTKPEDIPPLLQKTDQIMSANYWSLPIFAFPGVTAFRPDIQGVVQNATQTQASWNMQDWARS
jgi:peptide/nickel transport system substrate-binding protein